MSILQKICRARPISKCSISFGVSMNPISRYMTQEMVRLLSEAEL